MFINKHITSKKGLDYLCNANY